uniref:Tax1-binding protein 1 homolog A-like n=1 Tax=Sinocyclocheilus grahami TaxID=75366 RepID=A0A672KPB9_SINGR
MTIPSAVPCIQTSNFAHVIFQNVGKSFLPQAALECHYTLTPFLTPHPKDWVGIFKVGTSLHDRDECYVLNHHIVSSLSLTLKA